MYTLRLVPSLLHDLDVDDQAAPPPTTRLGDWDVVPLEAGGRALLVCVSDRADLPIVLPRPDLADLPEALGIALVPVLRAVGIADDAIGAEIDEMATGMFGAAIERRRLMRVRALARRAGAWVEQAGRSPIDVAALHAMLLAMAGGVRGRGTIAARTRAAFAA